MTDTAGPLVDITCSWNAGSPRWGWVCRSCGAKAVGMRRQFDAHRRAQEHECPPEVTP